MGICPDSRIFRTGALTLGLILMTAGFDNASGRSASPPDRPPAKGLLDHAKANARLHGKPFASLSKQERRKFIASRPPTGDGLDIAIKALASDPDPAVRAEAARQLALNRNCAADAGLAKALDDPESEVVIAAVNALIRRGNTRMVPRMRAALKKRKNTGSASAQAIKLGIEALEKHGKSVACTKKK